MKKIACPVACPQSPNSDIYRMIFIVQSNAFIVYYVNR